MNEAMQEESSVARINHLLEQVEKEIYDIGSKIYTINKRLLTEIPLTSGKNSVVSDSEKKKIANEGWFVQTIIKLETIRDFLQQITKGEIQRLERSIRLSELESGSIELEREIGGTHFDGRRKLNE